MSYLAAAGLAIGATETVIGMVNSGKAADEAARLQDSQPKRSTSQFARNELSLAESELANGMSAATKQAYQEGIDRDLCTSLSSALKYGGGVNMVGDLYDKSTLARQKFSMIQENLRLNKIQNTIAAYRNMSEEQDKNFQFNQWAPWADKAQGNAIARQNAANMTMSGINTAGGAIMNKLSTLDAEGDYDNYMNQGNNSSYIAPNYKPFNSATTVPQPSNAAITPPPQSINPNTQPLPIQNNGWDINLYNNPETGFFNKYD